MHSRNQKSKASLPRLVTFAGGLWLLIGLASCRPFYERQVAATVLAIDGQAEHSRGGENSRLTTERWILPGDRISTSPQARLDLRLVPGVLVELAGETEIEIEELRISKDGDESIQPMTAREARVRLLRGSLNVAIGRTQARSRLTINTAAGRLSSGSGRTFRIEAADKTTRLTSVRGNTSFEPVGGGAGTKVGPGQFAEWPGSGEPKDAATAGAQAQGEIGATLAAEKRLRRLEKNAPRSLQSDAILRAP